MPKSAVRLAREALAAGRAALPEYGIRCSRRDYAQPQLFARLVLRQFLRTDYRSVVALVSEWSELRRALGLAKVPHYSTLAHASRRILAGAGAGAGAGAEAGGLSAERRPRLSDAHTKPSCSSSGRRRGRPGGTSPTSFGRAGPSSRR